MLTVNIDHIKRFDNYTIKSQSPAGTIYLHIMEYDGKPVKIMCSAGKCGSEFSSFVSGICNLISSMLEDGKPLIKAIAAISDISTDKVVRDSDGVDVRSGIGGVCNVLLKYIRMKQQEVRVKDYDSRMDKRNSSER